jgi:prepilin-type N-terminal cleavage/methylation domain-containing protein
VRRNTGFTLIEIMLVLAIAAIIMSAGIAPLLYTARMLRASRENFSQANRERSAANRIFADIREITTLNAKEPVVIAKYDDLASSGENDFLLVRTLATANTTAPLTSAVWGVPGKTALRSDFRDGLYRWALSNDVLPGGVSVKALDPSDATLVLPGVSSVSFAALRDSDWTREYRGALPKALRIIFSYPDRNSVYEELLPNF